MKELIKIKNIDLHTPFIFVLIIGLFFSGFSLISLDLTSYKIFITPFSSYYDYQNNFINGIWKRDNPTLYESSILRYDQIFLMILISIVILRNSFRNQKNQFFLLIFFSLISFSSIFSNDIFSYTNHLKGLLQTLILLFLLNNFSFIFINCNLDRMIKWFFYVGYILCLYALYQFIGYQYFQTDIHGLSNFPLTKFYFNNPSVYGPSAVNFSDGFYRVTSIFKEPSNFAFVLNCLILLRYSQVKHLFYKDLTFLIFTFFLFLTQSMFNVIFFIFFIFYIAKNNIKILSILLFLIILIFSHRLQFIIFSFIQILLYYLGFLNDLSLADPSFDYRFDKILIGLKIFSNHPFFGIGLNNLSIYTGEYESIYQSTYSSKLYVLNFFLIQHLVELGILSTTILYLILFKYLKPFFKFKEVYLFIILNIFYQDLPFYSSFRIFSFALMAIVFLKFINHKTD